MRLGFPSSLNRSAFLSKTHRFESARESRDLNEKAHISFLCGRSVDGRKRIKMETMTENIAGACVCSMRLESNLRHNFQFSQF